MLLLRPAQSATLIAGQSGNTIGYGDGTSGAPFPGVDIGELNFVPAFFNGVTLHYVYTDSSVNSFRIGLSASLAAMSSVTITIGGDTYTNSDLTSASTGGSGVRYNYTLKNALVNGNTYSFKVV